jgi:cardiolipin synthase
MIEWARHLGWLSIVVAGGAALTAAILTSAHAILYKRDDRGTMMWVGLIWAVPIIGSALYLAFGINRIKRRAVRLRRNRQRCEDSSPSGNQPPLPSTAQYLMPLAEMVTKVTGSSLLGGNDIQPLLNAKEAYPAMLEAIQAATHTIAVSTYIFDRDEVGLEFAARLGAAVRRGVQVRVLIDATGTLFTRHSIVPVLRRNGVTFARFLPALTMGELVSLNLRNHRKLLVVDGRIGFTGGMNLCAARLRTKLAPVPMEDVQFRVLGPVVRHLQLAFIDDWQFTTGKILGGEDWLPPIQDAGPVLARGIADGPDEEFEQTRWTLLGAITAARQSLRILTPYFLPDSALISALNVAALRGVSVDIVLPTDSDVPFVQWASEAHWWQLLEHGCRIWVTPHVFDHSKIFVVDEVWALVGSSNWDARSLRLNFEFNLECYAPKFATDLAELFDERKRRARQVSLAAVNNRSLSTRLRDGMARLAAPFL